MNAIDFIKEMKKNAVSGADSKENMEKMVVKFAQEVSDAIAMAINDKCCDATCGIVAYMLEQYAKMIRDDTRHPVSDAMLAILKFVSEQETVTTTTTVEA